MADFYINAETFDLATSIYADIALSTLAPDGFYSMDNGYRQQVGGVLLSGITTCDDPIVANNDSYSSIVTAGMNGNNILANDTVNGVPATTGNVQIAQVSSTNANVNINTSNGAVVVNTIVPVGTYSIVYRICQLSNITNCATANISVNVTPLTIQHCYNFDTTCELACDYSSYPFAISIGDLENPVVACGQASATTVYCDTSIVANGSIFYTNSGMTTTFNGNNSWFKVFPSSSVVWLIDTDGVVVSNTSCSTPPSFSINSSVSSEGTGTLDIVGGEPFEVIDLSFVVDPDEATFIDLTFTSPVSVGSLEPLHLSRNGTMTLDSSGSGSSVYDFNPPTNASMCLVTVISRSSGLIEGIGDDTNF